MNDKKPNNIFSFTELAKSFATGCTAGSAVAAMTFPLEGLKKRIQGGEFTSKGFAKVPEFWNKWRSGNIKLYGPGLGIFMAHVGPASAAQFMVKAVLADYYKSGVPAWQTGVAAMTSGIVGAATAATIVECTVRRQQIWSQEANKPVDARAALGRMIKQYGWRSPWDGFAGIALRDGVFTGCMLWATPEAMKYAKANYGAAYEQPASLVVSTMGAVVTHPADTLATRIQQDRSLSYMRATKEIIKTAGVSGLWHGVSMRILLFAMYSQAIPKARDVVENRVGALLASQSLFSRDTCKIDADGKGLFNGDYSMVRPPIR